MRGWVEEILPRINFKRERVEAIIPDVVFIGGYGYDVVLMRENVLREDTFETRKLRGYKGY